MAALRGSGEEDVARLEQYAFVPLALRHDFKRDGDESPSRPVEIARRTRSALLVSTLLYGADDQPHDNSAADKTTRKPRAKEAPATKPPETPPLYSLSVELGISKRAAFIDTVKQLDAYFAGIRATVDELDWRDASIVPSWLSGASSKLPTLLQVQRKVVQTVSACFPECDVYLAMYEPLPMADPTAASPSPLLRYVAASPQSSMVGQVLHRESIPPTSFSVLDSLDPVLIGDIGEPAASHIRFVNPMDANAVRTGPFACLPLVDAEGRSGIGVLALDACRKAAQLRPEAMSPEALHDFLVRMQLPDAAVEFRARQFGGNQLLQLTPNDLQHRPAFRNVKIQSKQGVMEIVTALRKGVPLHLPNRKPPAFFSNDEDALVLLDDVCERAGKFLDRYRREVHWLRVLAMRTKDARTKTLDVYAALVQAIASALVGVERVSIWKIRGGTDIDGIATTHIPVERLSPFTQWNERQIRRLPLHAEDGNPGRLLQGNVTRINVPPIPPSDSGRSGLLCERAIYHVAWTNHTHQSLSWSQLRLLLPIRPMNARHYQLSQLLKNLQSLMAQPGYTTSSKFFSFQLEDSNALVALLRDPLISQEDVYAIQVDFLARPRAAQEPTGSSDEVDRFLHRAVAITNENLACVRGRVARLLGRQLSSVKTTRNFNSLGLTPSPDALRALDDIASFVFKEITTNLPGTQQQIAELQADGTQLRFTFTSNGSTLWGKTLNRGMGVSFRCIDARSPLIVDRNSELRPRLKLLGASQVDIETDLPYVFIPLLYEDCCLGLLSVNRFVDVPKGRSDEMHPEEGVVEYLTSMAKPLAAAIYLKRRSYALHSVKQLRDEPLQSPERLFAATCSVLRDTVVGIWKLRVIEIDFVRGKSTAVFDDSEMTRLQATTEISRRVIPLGYRSQELLPDTVMNHWSMSAEDVNALLHQCRQHEEDTRREENEIVSKMNNEMERRKRWEWLVRRRYYDLRLDPLDSSAEGITESKDSKKREQAFGARTTNEKYVSQALSTYLSSKCFVYAGIQTLHIGMFSGVFIAAAVQPQFLAKCEQSFVDRVADMLSRVMESLLMRVERSRRRIVALERLNAEAAAAVRQVEASLSQKPVKDGAFPLSGEEELRVEGGANLLEFAACLISSTLDCPCVYFALHEPYHRRLQYVATSPESSMKGKMLHRGHGVSFHSLDSQQALVITPTTQEEIEKMYGHGARIRMFSNDAIKWPVIIVPVGSFGVLALDNLAKYARLSDEEQPEFGLVDFLRRSATVVAEAVGSIRLRSRNHRRQRREEAIVQVMAACDDLGKSASPLYVQHIVLQAIEGALNGVDAYIGIIQPLCSSIQFTSATGRSGMLNQQVNAVDSVSYQVFISQRPLIIPRLEQRQYDSSEISTGRLVSQLRWFTPVQAQGRKGPFVCIPIPFVGVLSVDTFRGAAGGVYSPKIPEHGVLDCLTTMANLLGEHSRRMKATEASCEIPRLFQGNRSTFCIIFGELLHWISLNVLTAVEMAVVCYDETRSWLPVHGVTSPLVALKSPVQTRTPPVIADIESSILQSLQATGGSPRSRCVQLPIHPEVIVVQCLDCRDVDSSGDGSVDWSRSCNLFKTAIVIRRACGATWSYDHEFLSSILPLIDDLVTKINLRVSGIVARRNALQKLGELCSQLENSPLPSAPDACLSELLCDALTTVTEAASKCAGDAYIGDRVIGGESLEYIAASKSSSMRGVHTDLISDANQNLVSVACLRDQRRKVVYLHESNHEQIVRQLTSKKGQRVFVAIPMSEDRVLCVDSLGVEAFDTVHDRLEHDVEVFLTEVAALLETTLSTLRYRFSYNQLSRLKFQRHVNMCKYFAAVHEILRRDVNLLHSQQILELAVDFTGQFRVRSWHQFPTRRPTLGSASPHFCFINGCDHDGIIHDIHFEQHVSLPMTNLPRTLDKSRAEMQPGVGREKQGAFACDCMAVMLDSGLETVPRLALCVFSHDKTKKQPSIGSSLPAKFTHRQRDFFFAFGAVASEVYRHVFRACVLETFGVESLFIARDRLNAKDAVLLKYLTGENQSVVEVVTGCSIPAKKWLRGSQVVGHLAERVTTFRQQWDTSDVHISVTVMKASATPSTISISKSPNPSSTASSRRTEVPAKVSFFKRPHLFKSREKHELAPAASSPESLMVVSPSPSPRYEVHILLCGHHHDEVLSLVVERETTNQAVLTEQISLEVRQLMDEFRDRRAEFLANTRGDEEWNGAGFGESLEIGEGGCNGGGGFHVLACWSKWRDDLRNELVHFDSDIRSYLTGAQATSRGQLGRAVVVDGRSIPLPSPTPAPTQRSLFSRDHPSVRNSAMVLVRASLVMCGYKKEVAVDSPSDKDDELLKEYLRASVGKKILELNPRSVTRWPMALRAGNYLRAMHSTVRELVVLAETDDAGGAGHAARLLLYLEQAFISSIKYFKFLDDNINHRKQRIDALATRVQCAYRVVLAKKMLRRLKIEFTAALAIQCAFRQHLARRRRAFLKWTHATVTVQRAYRRKLAQRRGRRPRKLTLELRTVAAQYGSMLTTGASSGPTYAAGVSGAWNAEMEGFDSFKAYMDSAVGRDQLRKEERVIAERLKEVAQHREQTLSTLDRLLADVHDIFELLDVDGSSELSRDCTRELMMRLHVPLTGDEVDDVINMMDNDRSGSISFVEFTSWLAHEFDLLKKRNRECGVLSKRDRQWIAEESARSALRKRWHAHQRATLKKPNELNTPNALSTENVNEEEVGGSSEGQRTPG